MKRMTFHKQIPKYIKNENFPWFISFPRTGSHWLRIVMEYYLGIPALVQSWTIKNPSSFWAYHQHDYLLKEIKNKKNVLYLYRNPIDTLFSQMSYENENFSERIDYNINIYSNHLIRWRFNHNDIKNITICTYENLKNNPTSEITKILHFLQLCQKDIIIDEDKINNAYNEVSKDKVKEKTLYSEKSINITSNYEMKRIEFKNKYGNYILDKFKQKDERLTWEKDK